MDFGFFKRHPMVSGAVVLIGGVVFFVFFRGGGSAPSGGSAGGPSDAQVSASTALQMAQTQGNFALAAAKVQAEAQNHAIDVAAVIKAKDADTGLASILAQIQGQMGMGSLELEGLKAQLASGEHIAQMTTSAQLSAAQLAAGLQSQEMEISGRLSEIDKRTAYDVAAWNYVNTNTAIRLAGDANTIQSQSNERITNSLIDLIKTS